MPPASQIGFLHGAAGADLRRRAGGDHLAIDQHGDRVGEVEHHAHVVLHHDQRLALRHAADQRHGVFGFAVAHAGGRFVEQDHAGAAGDRHADLQRALFGVGQQPGRHVASRGQVQILQQPLGRLVQRALPRQQVPERIAVAAAPQQAQRRFSNTVSRGKIEVIWKLRDRPSRLIRCGGRPIDARRRSVRSSPDGDREAAADQVEQRGLARAVRADDARAARRARCPG